MLVGRLGGADDDGRAHPPCSFLLEKEVGFN